MKVDSVISTSPPSDGREWDCQCARCGSSCFRIECEACDDGHTAPGELHEEDPLWYDEDDYEKCSVCEGALGWWACISDSDWCKKHPAPGREGAAPGAIEWFTYEPKPRSAP